LGNFISIEEIKLFYETGNLDMVDEYCEKKLGRKRNWEPIYFKDENGKNTSKLAMIYVYNPEINYFEIKDVEESIGLWINMGANNYLETQVANGVRVILQSQASSNEDIGGFKYGWGIFYCNDSGGNLGGFQSGIFMGSGVEQYGVRGEILQGEQKSELVGLFKARAARDCCKYLLVITGNKKFNNLIRSYQAEIDSYTQKYWINEGKSPDELELLYAEARKLFIPFGAESWEEIDAVLGNN
jgi:hypothetical protein